jgi:hypothetical protein
VISSRRGHLVAVGLVGAALFGATASPALASDELEPLAGQPVDVDELEGTASSPLDALGALTDATEAEPATIGVDAAVDSGGPDVSDRVPSPDSAGAEAVGNALEDVISSGLGSDIAASATAADVSAPPTIAEEVGVTAPETPTTPSPAAEPASLSQVVAVPALDSIIGPEERSEADGTRASDPARAEGGNENDVEQYHDGNSRYQSELVSNENSWTWKWYLEIDCSGVASSTSEEVGDNSFNNWAWTWTWNWTCGLDGASEAARDELLRGAPPAAVSIDAPAPAADPVAARDGQEADSAWLWTWTFTFCGQQTTITTRTNVDPLFSWIWDWTWDWACTAPSESGDGAPAADEGSSSSSDTDEPLPWIDELMLRDEPADSIVSHAARAILIPWLALPPGPRVVSGATPISPQREKKTARTPVSPAASATTSTATSAGGAPATSTSPYAPAREATAPRTRERRGTATPRPARQQKTQSEPLSRRAAGTPGSSSSATGGSGAAAAVAALTRAIVLAAPGLGRFIRESRELSPRDPDGSRLERPG